jgi:glycine cleavage system H protein
VDEGVALNLRQEIGNIESKKAESALYSPITGTLDRFNAALMKDPSTINVDKYGGGWLFEMTGEGSELLSPESYIDHLQAVWEVTQRTIKGQMNEA